MAKQFWPKDIQVVTARSPLAVVTEAASQLAEITQGLVEANVRSGATKTGYLSHRLWIEAPTLGYEKAVARFEHLPTPIYPVWAQRLNLSPPVYREAEGMGGVSPAMMKSFESTFGNYAASGVAAQEKPLGDELTDEEALENWLGAFLGEPEIVKLINGLIATANSSGVFLGEEE